MIQRTEQEIMKNWQLNVNPVVSVCCTTYNHENYISDAIDGFLMQETDFPFEVIIRDDCSTDNTINIISKYVDKYPNIIKPIYETENQFSKGIRPMPIVFKKAKGTYFALCEGDDYWTNPLKLNKQIDVFENNPKVTLCFHPAEELDELNNTNIIICKHSRMDKEIPFSNVILGRGGYMPTASLMFKNIQIDEMLSSFEYAPIGDYFIQAYMASIGSTYYLKELMCVYRRNTNNSWTFKQNEKQHRLLYNFEMVLSIDKFSAYLQNRNQRVILFSVLKFYATGYISNIEGVYKKLKALHNTGNLLLNYNKNKYKMEIYFFLIKNKLLGMKNELQKFLRFK